MNSAHSADCSVKLFSSAATASVSKTAKSARFWSELIAKERELGTSITPSISSKRASGAVPRSLSLTSDVAKTRWSLWSNDLETRWYATRKTSLRRISRRALKSVTPLRFGFCRRMKSKISRK